MKVETYGFMDGCRCAFQLIFALTFAWIISIEFSIPMQRPSVVGKFVFLTTQTMAIVFLYASGNLVCEVSRIFRFRLETMELGMNWGCCAVAGLSWFVFIMFYSVIYFDPKFEELIARFESIETSTTPQGIPMRFYSHLFHFASVPFMFVDSLLKRRGLLLASLGKAREYVTFFFVYGCCYVSLLTYNNRVTGAWPYPIMERFSVLQHCFFYVFCLGLSLVLSLGYARLLPLLCSPSANTTASSSSSGMRTRSKAAAELKAAQEFQTAAEVSKAAGGATAAELKAAAERTLTAL